MPVGMSFVNTGKSDWNSAATAMLKMNFELKTTEFSPTVGACAKLRVIYPMDRKKKKVALYSKRGSKKKKSLNG